MRTRKGYADGPFGQVHFQALGDGVPLVLLHQSPSSSDMFGAAYPLLAAAGVRAIGVDSPGFGQSDPPPGTPTIGGYALAALAVMDHLGLDEAAVLGHHTGAAIAAELAVTAARRVSRVILNGPPLLTPEEVDAFRAALDASPLLPPQADGSHLTALWQRRVTFTPGWSSLEAMHAGVVQMLIAGSRGWDGFKAAFAYDIETRLRALTQPCMILTNTGDDLHVASRRAQRLRPDFAWRELPRGTHDIVDEQPLAWSRAVVDFLLRD
jgi:pimeloyl-ACP methyl ester carboxylesterase